MTNLTQKITALETFQEGQFDRVIEALEALLPPGIDPDAITLADLRTVLMDIKDNTFGTWGEAGNTYNQLHWYLGPTQYAVTEVRDSVNLLAYNMAIWQATQEAQLTGIQNLLGRLNTTTGQGLSSVAAAILATACACEGTNTSPAPPLNTTPSAIPNTSKCARIQAWLAAFTQIIDDLSNHAATGAGLSISIIGTIISAAVAAGGIIGGELGAVAGPPGIVIGAVIGIITSLLATVGQLAFASLGEQWHTAPLLFQIRDGLYNVNDAASGKAVYDSVIDNSGVLSAHWKPLLKTLMWSSWMNDLYNPSVTIDASGFDGSICQLPTPPPTGYCGNWPNTIMQFNPGDFVEIQTPYGKRWVPNWAKYGVVVVDDGRPDEMAAVYGPCVVRSYVATGTGLQFYQSDEPPELNVYDDMAVPSGDVSSRQSKVIFWSYLEPFSLTIFAA